HSPIRLQSGREWVHRMFTLGSTLALALFLPAVANAELLKNLKVGGQLDVQTTAARNVRDFATRPNTVAGNTPLAANNDRIGIANTRAMLKLDWDLLDDVHARVTMVKGASNHAVRTYGLGAQDLNTIQSATFVEEAFVKIDKLFGFTDMTLGRQFYGEPGDLVVYYGPRDNYGLTVSALDAGRFDWNGEMMTVTGVVGKLADTAVSDNDLRGLVVSCNKNENVKGSAYVYNAVVHAVGGLGSTTGKNTFLYVAGIKSKLTFGGLMASVEFAKNFGSDRTTADFENYKGFALLAKAAYKADLQDVGAFTPWGEFGYGTGDARTGVRDGNRTFQSINTDYRPGGIYGRFADGAAVSLYNGGSSVASDGLSNRVIWGVGFKATPAALDKLTAGVQFYKYAFHTRVSDTNNSRSIGSEFDLTTEWKHSENVSLKGTLGSFQPGQYIAQLQTAKNPATMAALDFSVKF
ncbi:MAG: hypothetical protein AAB262_14290, partial [Elusimicrobiota bacterium]